MRARVLDRKSFRYLANEYGLRAVACVQLGDAMSAELWARIAAVYALVLVGRG